MSLAEAHRLTQAETLAHRLPRLMLSARQTAATLSHGLHGRRQAGGGETFWQYRPFQSGEPAARIDWRRSAKDQRLCVKEREWEAAHSIHLWADCSASMFYGSSAKGGMKIDRAVMMMLALAEVLVEGGERIGLCTFMPPKASRRIMNDLSDHLALHQSRLLKTPLPAPLPLPQRAEAIVFTDGFAPLAHIDTTLKGLSGHGAKGHLVLINDVAEETFPFSGRTDFLDPMGGHPFKAQSASELRSDYCAQLAHRREALLHLTRSLGWGLMQHRTDQSAATALLALHQRLSARRR